MKKANSTDLVRDQLSQSLVLIEALEPWTVQNLEDVIRNLQEKNDWHRGQYFMMLRIATTGEKATPPLFETMIVLGKDLVINRLKEALKKLN